MTIKVELSESVFESILMRYYESLIYDQEATAYGGGTFEDLTEEMTKFNQDLATYKNLVQIAKELDIAQPGPIPEEYNIVETSQEPTTNQ